MKRMLIETVLILLISTGVAIGAYALRSDKMPFFASGPSEIEPEGETGVKKISIETAISHFNAKTALFADARSLAEYEAGHIQDALHLYEKDIDLWLDDFFTNTPAESTIITYCSGDACPLGKNLAQKLFELGYANVFYLKDGWGKWNQHQMPTSK